MSLWSSIWNGVQKVGNAVFGNSAAVGGISSVISTAQQMKYQKELMALQNNYNVSASKDSYNYSKALQQFQNDYTTKMASSAHQIEVADLRAAGLNPILSATGGSGAVVPGAGNASVTQSGVSGAAAPDIDYLNSALAYRQQKNQNELTNTQTELNKAQKGLVNEQEHNAYQEGLNLFDMRDYIRKQTEDLDNQIKNRDLTTAANIKRMDTMNIADTINAIANREASSANSYYQRHRSLGFTDSYSTNDSYNNGGVSIFGFPLLPSKGGSSSYSHSRTR